MNRFHFLAICVVTLSVTTVSCGPAGTEQLSSRALSQAEAEARAQEHADTFDAASKSGDADALADLYVEDAIRFEPNKPARVGREAIRAGFRSEAEQFAFDITNRVEKVLVSEEWIFEQGSWGGTITPKGAPDATPREDRGYWIALRQRQPDGSWKTFRDMWVSELPIEDE